MINIAKQSTESGVHVTLEELLALQAAGSRLPFESRHRTHGVRAGDVLSNTRGRGLEFEEIRPYQAGDDIRSIDWRVSARTGRPFTKLYSEERERPIFVALDQRVNMFFGTRTTFKSVAAARLAALLCWSAKACGDRVGGLVAGDFINRVRSHSTRRAVLRFVDAIVRMNRDLSVRSQMNVPLSEMLQGCLLQSAPGATVVVISDFDDMDNAAILALTALGHRRKLLLVSIHDPVELAMPAIGVCGIGDGVTSTRFSLGKSECQAYLQQRQATDEQLHECVTQCAASLINATTEDDSVLIAATLVQGTMAQRYRH